MKIKTITCHDVYNFGASLQAYALQEFLVQNGHEVEIIDYLPKYKRFYDFFHIGDKGFWGKLKSKMPLLEPVWAVIRHRSWIRHILKIVRFKQFKRNMLHCTEQQYHSIEDFKTSPLSADLYIAGSDQIWNTAFQNGLDPVYYCSFESDYRKCITYAASFGISSIPVEHQDFVKKGLSKFRSISVREKTGVELVRQLGYEAVNVLDPVFLLTQEDWMSLFKKRHTEKYLLIYDFAKYDSRLEHIAVKIARDRGLKIYSFITNYSYIDKTLYSCGPIEFLEWIACADMVISNSFHASAFSVIFQRDFYTLPLLGHGNSSRMMDFLKCIGLSDRYVENIDSIDSNIHIDYECPIGKLQALQDVSRSWLLQNII